MGGTDLFGCAAIPLFNETNSHTYPCLPVCQKDALLSPEESTQSGTVRCLLLLLHELLATHLCVIIVFLLIEYAYWYVLHSWHKSISHDGDNQLRLDVFECIGIAKVEPRQRTRPLAVN